jgi:hypothetical protein
MPHVKLDVDHALALEQAKQAAKLAVDHYAAKFADRGLQITWVDDTHLNLDVTVRGSKVHGSVVILPSTLHIEADVPLLLLPFKSLAASAIEREAARWGALARTGSAEPPATAL